MKTINLKLNEVQTKLKVPKNQFNGFGKYNYRSCEDIMEAIKPLLLELKLTLVISDTIEHIGDRYYVKSIATITDGEESISTTGFAREEENKKGMDGSQVTGASSSYARKYALNGLFAIDDTKDSDNTNKDTPAKAENVPYNQTTTATKTSAPAQASSSDKATPEQISDLKVLAKKAGMTDEAMLKKYGAYIYKTPFMSVYNKVTKELQEYIDKKNGKI